jgi:hypothetical protein
MRRKRFHPTMRVGDAPPPGLATRCLLERLGLRPPRTEVRGEAKFGQQVPHLIIVIACVQTMPWGVSAEGLGRSTAIRSMVSRAILTSLRFAPATTRQMGTAPLSVSTLRFVPLLPRSVGLLPTFPPQARLWSSRHASPATPSQSPVRHHTPRAPVPIRP